MAANKTTPDNELQFLRTFYKLKQVYRENSVADRKESSAEHTWSAMILADYFLTKGQYKLDKLKVYDLLLYHDLVEIETGDIGIHREEARKDKDAQEDKAAKKLSKDIPLVLQAKYLSLHTEFAEQKTSEAKFAKAIDHLDAQIHELDNKDDWKGWTEEKTRELLEKYYPDFPDLKQIFEAFMDYAREHDFFDN
ncbi:MAG: HD domain-containing protein [Nanoarchaeota archaeon]|nr:HD domain-containing protein [Nanoarchaeota archaeon]